jgi:hypothetical protein
VGLILVKELLELLRRWSGKGDPPRVRELRVRPVPRLPAMAPLYDVLRFFKVGGLETGMCSAEWSLLGIEPLGASSLALVCCVGYSMRPDSRSGHYSKWYKPDHAEAARVRVCVFSLPEFQGVHPRNQ